MNGQALKSQFTDELDWLAARFKQLGLNRFFTFGDYAADPARAEETADHIERIRHARPKGHTRMTSDGHTVRLIRKEDENG